jgi:drug/metabolite transporter (DMT)-like permease
MEQAQDNLGRGIFYMFIYTLASAGMNAAMKWSSADYPASEIAFFRQVFAMLPVSLLIAFSGGPKLLKTTRPIGHLFRSVIGNGSLGCLVVAYRYLPLADVTAYSFTTPLFLTALSVPLMKETVGLHRWSAVLVGFIGVLIIMRPGATMNVGVGYALCAALFAAFAMITIRHLSRTEHPLTIVFYFTLFGALFTGAASMGSFRIPAAGLDWAVLTLTGCMGGVLQYCITMCFRYASPTRVAPYQYLILIWTLVLQFMIWGTLPDRYTMAGAALIVASGLYIIYRETRKHMTLAGTTPGLKSAD